MDCLWRIGTMNNRTIILLSVERNSRERHVLISGLMKLPILVLVSSLLLEMMLRLPFPKNGSSWCDNNYNVLLARICYSWDMRWIFDGINLEIDNEL
jgi:hypothetical protein